MSPLTEAAPACAPTNGVVAPPEPVVCPHGTTRTTRYEDGSRLVRCQACGTILDINRKESPDAR
jgi:hypothetical protein